MGDRSTGRAGSRVRTGLAGGGSRIRTFRPSKGSVPLRAGGAVRGNHMARPRGVSWRDRWFESGSLQQRRQTSPERSSSTASCRRCWLIASSVRRCRSRAAICAPTAWRSPVVLRRPGIAIGLPVARAAVKKARNAPSEKLRRPFAVTLSILTRPVASLLRSVLSKCHGVWLSLCRAGL
jgi:hypothetical protein